MHVVKITSVSKDVEMMEPSYTAEGNIKWYSIWGRSLVVFEKN